MPLNATILPPLANEDPFEKSANNHIFTPLIPTLQHFWRDSLPPLPVPEIDPDALTNAILSGQSCIPELPSLYPSLKWVTECHEAFYSIALLLRIYLLFLRLLHHNHNRSQISLLGTTKVACFQFTTQEFKTRKSSLFHLGLVRSRLFLVCTHTIQFQVCWQSIFIFQNRPLKKKTIWCHSWLLVQLKLFFQFIVPRTTNWPLDQNMKFM